MSCDTPLVYTNVIGSHFGVSVLPAIFLYVKIAS